MSILKFSDIIFITIFFIRFVSEKLKSILINLEDEVCFEGDSDEQAEMLKALYPNHKVKLIMISAKFIQFILFSLQIIGYSLNCKYTNLSSIITEIKNTGIHLNLDNKVEFALNVFVKEYVNNVLSVWIFLMSLVPKN